MLIAIALLALLVYLSRYWTFRWWDREGLVGIAELRPQGELVRTWLRGTPFAAFDILAWGVGGFLLLSVVQSLWSRVIKLLR